MKFRTEASAISLGMILVVLMVGTFAGIVERTVSGKPYDERQELAQGKAAKGAFYAMIFSVWTMLLAIELFEMMISCELMLWLTLHLGITVYASIAIWKDAYVNLTQSYEKSLLSLGALTGYRWLRLMDKIPKYTFAPQDSECWIDIGGVVTFTWITGLLLVKWLLKKQEEAKEE